MPTGNISESESLFLKIAKPERTEYLPISCYQIINICMVIILLKGYTPFIMCNILNHTARRCRTGKPTTALEELLPPGDNDMCARKPVHRARGREKSFCPNSEQREAGV